MHSPASIRSARRVSDVNSMMRCSTRERRHRRNELASGTKSVAARLPAVLGAIAIVMFTLLFMLTGGIIVPVKALLLNTFSPSANLGAMVWIFRKGIWVG